ncbi:unnamed protein product [Paramecium pentaurelia]|uniref:Uncharacterized protein n=1 Tax=Paramecium pentaurelia TaxID=43138 RepID=A0A8S1XIC9_9CILI|nr:unnamed protein product [Paramecium pentaurelia]
MNYIDQGTALSRKVPNRKLSKKNSLFYQQSVFENEEFMQKYEKNVDQLQTVIEEPELKEVIQNRNEKFFQILEQIIKVESSIKEFSKGYQKYGFIVSDTGITYREWAPNAKELKLNEYSCTTDNGGNWEVFIPKDDDDNHQIQHGSKLITYCNELERASVWSSVRNGDQAIFWNPENKYEFQQQQLQQKQQSKGLKVIKQNIKELQGVNGYNAIMITQQLLMQLDVNLITPDDLKRNIDILHQKGYSVIMDIDHEQIGKYLNNWDGTGFQYLREEIEQLDYGKWEVLRLLLSNISFWITEYQIDGFKFSNIDITDDIDAAVYLMLANDLIHDLLPNGISIIQDLDYPALCRTIKEGGLGFDFKLSKLQHKQLQPKILYENTGVYTQAQILNALAIGQGLIQDIVDDKFVQIEQQYGWLENEQVEINEVNSVLHIKRGKFTFLINHTNENRETVLNLKITKILNKEDQKWEQLDENTIKLIVESEQGLIIE